MPVLWGTTLDRLEGTGRVDVRASPASHRFDGRHRRPQPGLPAGDRPRPRARRAASLRRRGAGYLATETDADGRTPVPGVFAVGDGATLGGARVGAGTRPPRRPGRGARPRLRRARRTRPLDARCARAETFQDALWRLFAAPACRPIADDTIVCRCEEVTAGRLRAEIAAGLTSLPALKKATRAGMGRCQGRFCAATIARHVSRRPPNRTPSPPRARRCARCPPPR